METLLSWLRAAGEPTRLRILLLCARAELSESELTQILGQSQPRVSRHLKLMAEAGVLARNREGARAFYRPADAGPSASLVERVIALVPEEDAQLAEDLVRLEEIRSARAERIAAYFEANAASWEDLRGLYADDEQVDRRLTSLIAAEPGGDLLDVGTGTGRVLRAAAPHVRTAVGLDKARPMLEIARVALDEPGLGNCRLRLGDMYHLPFPAERFDTVTLAMVLRYAEDPARALAEAARVLRPGGRVLLVDFAPHELTQLREEHAHRWLGFSQAEIARIAGRAGLEAEARDELKGEPLTVSIWQLRRPALQRRATA